MKEKSSAVGIHVQILSVDVVRFVRSKRGEIMKIDAPQVEIVLIPNKYLENATLGYGMYQVCTTVLEEPEVSYSCPGKQSDVEDELFQLERNSL